MSRSTLPLTFLVTAAVLLAPAVPAQDEAPEIFIDRVDVDVVNVEVWVRDRDGRPVAGLERDDFEVTEDGRPVEIANFYALSRGDGIVRRLEEDRARIEGRTVDLLREVPEDQRLHLLVYVDHWNLRPANRERVLAALEGFLEDRTIQGDRVMIVGYDGGFEVVEPFTRDAARLDRALERLRRPATHRQVDDNERRRTLRLMTADAGLADLPTTHQHLRSYVQALRADLRRSAAALEHAVRALAGLPGRKALLYVSDGLPQRPGEDLYQHLLDLFGGPSLQDLSAQDDVFVDPILETFEQDESHLFRSIIREANAQQVTLYTLDARGLEGGRTVAAEFAELASGPSGHVGADAMRTSNLQEPLIALADATGGAAILNTADFDAALAAMAADFDVFYSLGYRSPHGGDGKYHRIEVEVRRPDVVVRHRTGYVDKPPDERVADRTLSSLLLDRTKNPLGVEIDFAAPERGAGGRHVLPVLVRIPIRTLSLLPAEGVVQGRLRIFVLVQDAEGRISDLHTRPYPVTIPQAQLAEARGREIGYGVKLRVRAGTPKIAVGVWDELAGTESYVHKRVRVGADEQARR